MDDSPVGSTQRISYAPLAAMDDEMRAEMDRCRREAATKESGDYWAKH